jgi:hypothetical protein
MPSGLKLSVIVINPAVYVPVERSNLWIFVSLFVNNAKDFVGSTSKPPIYIGVETPIDAIPPVDDTFNTWATLL